MEITFLTGTQNFCYFFDVCSQRVKQNLVLIQMMELKML